MSARTPLRSKWTVPTPPLELFHHTGQPHVAAKPHARPPGGDDGHDHGRIAPLHVVDSRPVEAVVLDGRDPGVAHPAAGDRVDVEVSVEHQARPAADAGQPGDRLEPIGVDLLEPGLQPLRLEKLCQRRLVGGVARDLHQLLREPDYLVGVDAGQDPLLHVSHGKFLRVAGPSLTRAFGECRPGARAVIAVDTAAPPPPDGR